MGYTIWENAITFRAQKSKPLDSDTAGRPALRERERGSRRRSGSYSGMNGHCVKASLLSHGMTERVLKDPFTFLLCLSSPTG
jgi:hypothetical protein